MWHNIFFDQNHHFQWASIAAIISFLALCTTSVSVFLTYRQGKKNRKSTTLVNLRIEELKELREEAASLKLVINTFLNKRELELPVCETIKKTDPILNELHDQLNKMSSKLYRETYHAIELGNCISLYQMKLMDTEKVGLLTDLLVDVDEAIRKYSKIEYEEIEKQI
ncbi:hypothetical protein [Oceanobacillus sp. Castelsardo]|uniref:hypothetical protein n=1 Tax=Oceanobacillus sp. Castelsardo TaxID=1851204 RepID=UPI0008390874|nr:hypothetical protein [Oceanobacillus sp. Castelsardo]